jgi:hypothetical protein
MNDNIEGSSGKYALLLQSEFDTQQEMGMKAFLSDWREAFVISDSYGMGDPLAPIRRIGE